MSEPIGDYVIFALAIFLNKIYVILKNLVRVVIMILIHNEIGISLVCWNNCGRFVLSETVLMLSSFVLDIAYSLNKIFLNYT